MLATAGDVAVDEVSLLLDGCTLADYGLVRISVRVLTVRNLLLSEGGASAEAVSALAQSSSIEYMRVRVDQSSIVASFRQAGYPPMRVEWSTFMIKPLTFDTSVDEARRLFGIDTE